eukprot:NODE_830_length_1752_cov_41.203758_g682_i0.p2 GENE.NODE_830_length_1752_cov_41.203758_g682_i0~~NODE_830_length_1752_cov_41.203758_g682_i0.p2  ORF type:complete len:551 (-),score=174.35 NODE_830_length_1752_cov_41.203758_g682_i0:38-1690(-)
MFPRAVGAGTDAPLSGSLSPLHRTGRRGRPDDAMTRSEGSSPLGASHQGPVALALSHTAPPSGGLDARRGELAAQLATNLVSKLDRLPSRHRRRVLDMCRTTADDLLRQNRLNPPNIRSLQSAIQLHIDAGGDFSDFVPPFSSPKPAANHITPQVYTRAHPIDVFGIYQGDPEAAEKAVKDRYTGVGRRQKMMALNSDWTTQVATNKALDNEANQDKHREDLVRRKALSVALDTQVGEKDSRKKKQEDAKVKELATTQEYHSKCRDLEETERKKEREHQAAVRKSFQKQFDLAVATSKAKQDAEKQQGKLELAKVRAAIEDDRVAQEALRQKERQRIEANLEFNRQRLAVKTAKRAAQIQEDIQYNELAAQMHREKDERRAAERQEFLKKQESIADRYKDTIAKDTAEGERARMHNGAKAVAAALATRMDVQKQKEEQQKVQTQAFLDQLQTQRFLKTEQKKAKKAESLQARQMAELDAKIAVSQELAERQKARSRSEALNTDLDLQCKIAAAKSILPVETQISYTGPQFPAERTVRNINESSSLFPLKH